ncbi:M23 family metallopeptidase [Maritimibacter dapengensis]|uniref:Peptidoglycan DD-metalloendopeptidase family protein n=1 Tax=Maritimibacter dapengensis TaxID=2836868 RepID=A0ABS6T2F6_9RHOB|nr:M23 family metallopeptidase [Maritimibacter dapengensis]MBV7379434.1 peptidoglycan DD-metalloendopeptidase family protein [Maritimibacter dapengensis]
MGQRDGEVLQSRLNNLWHQFNRRLERHFPEQRLFLRSDETTRFVILPPLTQLIAWTGSAAFVAWAIIATAVLMMDSISSGNVREQTAREQRLYEERLQTLATERDARAAEAAAAQERFNLALAQISDMQSELLSSEERRRELEVGIDVIQSTLRRTMSERDEARGSVEAMLAEARGDAPSPNAPAIATGTDMSGTVDVLTAALEATAEERDRAMEDARQARSETEDLIYEARLREERNDQIFTQLEDAVTVSLEPLDKMFSAAGMSTDNILNTVRRGYSGQGGPLMPLILSTKGEEPSADMERANRILNELDRMNLYRIAAEKLPFDIPVRPGTFRYTSGFGTRWGRLHAGTDMAGPVGTPIHATADGVVIHADWQSGYGRLVKIQHEFGIETRYAHMSRIAVKKGQRVSRGERIGDMGNSGRSTGPHLHYEVRVGGKAVNPMTYIKAGRDVF